MFGFYFFIFIYILNLQKSVKRVEVSIVKVD